MTRRQRRARPRTGLGPGDVPEQQVLGDAARGRVVAATTPDANSDLISEPNATPAAVARVVERLDAGPITDQQQPPSRRDPRARRRRCRSALATAASPRIACSCRMTSVSDCRAERDAFRLEFAAQLAVVVDLAVEDDRESAIGRAHRLVAAAEVDDAEPAVTQPERAVDEAARVVGPAVRDEVAHPVQRRRVAGASRRNRPTMPHMSRDPVHLADDPLELAAAVRGSSSTHSMSMRMSSPEPRTQLAHQVLALVLTELAARHDANQQPVQVGLHDLRALDRVERLERMRQHRWRDQAPVAQPQQVLGLGRDVLRQLQRSTAAARRWP